MNYGLISKIPLTASGRVPQPRGPGGRASRAVAVPAQLVHDGRGEDERRGREDPGEDDGVPRQADLRVVPRPEDPQHRPAAAGACHPGRSTSPGSWWRWSCRAWCSPAVAHGVPRRRAVRRSFSRLDDMRYLGDERELLGQVTIILFSLIANYKWILRTNRLLFVFLLFLFYINEIHFPPLTDHSTRPMDYRFEDCKEVGEWRGDVVAFW